MSSIVYHWNIKSTRAKEKEKKKKFYKDLLRVNVVNNFERPKLKYKLLIIWKEDKKVENVELDSTYSIFNPFVSNC